MAGRERTSLTSINLLSPSLSSHSLALFLAPSCTIHFSVVFVLVSSYPVHSVFMCVCHLATLAQMQDVKGIPIMQQCIITLWLSSISINPVLCNHNDMCPHTHAHSFYSFSHSGFHVHSSWFLFLELISWSGRFHTTAKDLHEVKHSHADTD